MTLSQVLLAGVFVSGVVLLLGASRLIDLFNWLVPRPVVRGVQLGVGAKLVSGQMLPTSHAIACHLLQMAFTIACDCTLRHCWGWAPSW